MSDRKFFLIWVTGFLFLLFGNWSILVVLEAKNLMAFISTTLWTSMWLLFYTPFIAQNKPHIDTIVNEKEDISVSRITFCLLLLLGELVVFCNVFFTQVHVYRSQRALFVLAFILVMVLMTVPVFKAMHEEAKMRKKILSEDPGDETGLY